MLYLPEFLVGVPIPISGVDHGCVWWAGWRPSAAIHSDLEPVESSDTVGAEIGGITPHAETVNWYGSIEPNGWPSFKVQSRALTGSV